MKNKNWLKIILDCIMAILLILMYNKRVISMSFHEVGGLFVCGLFIIHTFINWKWVKGVTSKLFSKQLPLKTKISWIINFLLLLCTLFIALSGIMISKTIFTSIGTSSMFFKIGHQVIPAYMLILIGLHVGLHWTFIKGMFKKIINLPEALTKPLGLLCMIILLLLGSYNMATSSFAKWMAMPFQISTMSKSGQGEKGNRPEGEHNENMPSKDSFKEDIYRQDGKHSKGDIPTNMADGKGSMPSQGGMTSTFSVGQLINVLYTYSTIMSVWAIIAYWISKLLHQLHNKNKISS